MPPSLRERRKAQTRALILDRATAILEAQGFDALTMRALAKDLGVAPGTLFNYFPDKASLLLAALDAPLNALHQRALAALTEDPARPPVERIRDALELLLGWHLERLELSRALHQHALFDARAARFHARHDALAAQIAWQLGDTAPNPRAVALSHIAHLRYALLEGLATSDADKAYRTLRMFLS